MIRSLIAIATLVASVSASAGELDGKALLCQRDDYPAMSPYGFEFRDGKLHKHWVITRDGGTRAVVVIQDDIPYTAKLSTVEWDEVFSLDRKTLTLTSGYDFKGEPYWTASCEISPSVGAMKQAMEMDRQDLQRQIDEEMKDNKI